MTTIRKAWVPLGLVAFWAAGCGGGGSSTPLTESQFCDQKSEKECQVTTTCGGNTATKTACLTQRKDKCLAFVATAKTPPTPRVFHPENVPACVNKTAAVYKLATIKPTDLADMDDICAYVFQGPSTTTCTVKYDCAGGANAKICDKGVCAAKVTKNKGAFCTNPGEVCAAGSYCAKDPANTDPNSGVLTCLAKAGQGEACSATVPCLEALRCDATTNTCMSRVASGESCTSSDDCPTAAPYCDPYITNPKRCDLGLIFAPTAVAACADYGGAGTGTGTGGSGGGQGGSGGGNSDAGTGDAASGG